MSNLPGTIERPELDANDRSTKSAGWIVTVFNNDQNTYEEVMTILTIATSCTAEEAYIEAWEVDHLGKSVVHQACEKECKRASSIIATIGIQVEVSQE